MIVNETDKQCTYNVALRRFRVTIVAVEKHKLLTIISVLHPPVVCTPNLKLGKVRVTSGFHSDVMRSALFWDITQR
jgi:hypothetical protein